MSDMIAPPRPWVTPTDVKEYSELQSVQNRTDVRLAVDISRAEKYVINYTHNDFEGFEEIPQDVKTAVIILAEAYAHNAVEQTKSLKSETFDDYSYTVESNFIDLSNLDVGSLLDEWVKPLGTGKVVMNLRKL